ncbi:MAG TPA: hypothetical protein VIM07_15690 [Chitinophagaceae bacterium]
MEKEIIETVLTEICGELKQSNELLKENSKLATENKNRLIVIEKKLESKDVKPSIDMQPIEQIVSRGVDNIAAIIDQPTKKRRPEFRFLFFPEHNTKEYYKIVYGRIIFWLVMLVIAKYLYLLGSEWISKNYDDQKYKKAWENLYQQQGKANQKMMEKLIDH